MASYLDLVNKVIQESSSEADELTSGTWTSAEAGRRIYPRIKRNVADAWKLIQMRLNEWEFKTQTMSMIIYPRVFVNAGSRSGGEPPVGSVFHGGTSGFQFTVRQVFTTSGSWTAGTAVATIEFGAFTGVNLRPGETYTEVAPSAGMGTFVYISKGAYSFKEVDPTFREPQWSTFTASQASPLGISATSFTPVFYIPWDNWRYNEYSFTTSSKTAPLYVSQDPFGNVVFYPQTLNPFRISFIYNTSPQILSDKDDVPYGLLAEYHDWIAWEALMMFALFDKNPDLYAYAKSMATQYSTKANRDLMPVVFWASSGFNYSSKVET